MKNLIDTRFYTADMNEEWDRLCERSLSGNFLHSRRFLSYHGDRFVDRSIVIERQGRLVGVFAAAEDPSDPMHVVSHPGITFGGIIQDGELRGEAAVDALSAVARFYRSLGYGRLTYKVVPSFYHLQPCQDDVYALFRLGAKRVRCDLTSTLDLLLPGARSERRRRSLKKAVNAGVRLSSDRENIEDLWEVLSENLTRKHGVKPVHSLTEIRTLMSLFPDAIKCVCALIESEVVAGTVLFNSRHTSHAQYIASNLTGYEVSALDVVFDGCIRMAANEGKRWFDFGISTERQGTSLNESLFKFKSEFGCGTYVHEFYELELETFGGS